MLATKKKYIRVFSLILVSIFILTNTAVYAQTFTDVPDNHWAKEYIDKMNNLGAIKGDNGKFNPTGNVTRLEAVVMMSRLLSVDKDAVSQAKKKYQSVLDEVGIQTWFQDGVAVALVSGIVSEDTVRTFRTNGKDNAARRDEICIYLTRTMGLEEKAKSRTGFFPKFKDVMLISTQAMGYIDVMAEKGIINENGDAEGKFNPKSPITRAEMAKMLSKAYDEMKDGGTSVTVPTVPTTDAYVKTVKVSGTISNVLRATDLIYITVEDRDGDKFAYKVDSTSDVKLDGKTFNYNELVAGLEIEAKVTEDSRVVSLEAEGINEDYSGVIKSVVTTNSAMLTIEYEVKNGKSTDTEKKSFYISDDADITIDGKDAYVRNLEVGDFADIKVKNSKIVEIDAQSKHREIKGTIKEIKFTPDPVLVIEDKDEETYELSIDSKATIYRNKKKAQISDLRRGDEIEIEVEYNKITDIAAKIVKNEDEGSIVSILISNKPEITIRNKDGETNTYYVSNKADIEVGRYDSDIYGLKLGYFVELDIEGDEVVSIDSEIRVQNDRYTGVVESVISKAGIVVISVTDNTTGEEQIITVYVDNNTTYIDTDGSIARLSYLDKGDEILVMGNFDGTIFMSKSILILQDNN